MKTSFLRNSVNRKKIISPCEIFAEEKQQQKLDKCQNYRKAVRTEINYLPAGYS